MRHYIEALRFPSYIVAPIFLAFGLAFGGEAIKEYRKEVVRQNEPIMSIQEENSRFCTGMALLSSGVGLSALFAPSIPKLIDDLSRKL